MMLTAFKVWWSKSKWVLYALLSLIFVIIGFVFRGLFTGPENGPITPKAPKALEDAAKRAQEEALVARAQAAARTEIQTARIKQIMSNPDGDARRTQLAEWLKAQ